MKSNIQFTSSLIAKLTIITAIALFNFNSAFSAGPLGLHFKAGLSTPNDKVSKVYSDENLTSNNISTGDFFIDHADLGYHLGVAARIELSQLFHLVGGVEFHRFPRSEFRIKVLNEDTGEMETHKFKSTQNIFPVHAGINFAVINSDLLGVYATGGLAYNYISNSVDIVTEESDFSVPLDLSPTDSRAGYFFGAGTDINLQIFKLNLEMKYHHINLIGKDTGELEKKFFTVSLGIIL